MNAVWRNPIFGRSLRVRRAPRPARPPTLSCEGDSTPLPKLRPRQGNHRPTWTKMQRVVMLASQKGAGVGILSQRETHDFSASRRQWSRNPPIPWLKTHAYLMAPAPAV